MSRASPGACVGSVAVHSPDALVPAEVTVATAVGGLPRSRLTVAFTPDVELPMLPVTVFEYAVTFTVGAVAKALAGTARITAGNSAIFGAIHLRGRLRAETIFIFGAPIGNRPLGWDEMAGLHNASRASTDPRP
jgi:hypothetical protein